MKRLVSLLFVIIMSISFAAIPAGAQDTECEDGYRAMSHAMGENCIPEAPERVVVLDTGEVDNALALGASIVGAPVGDVLQYQEYLSDQLEGIEDTGTISEPNLEAILALAPDLILGSKQRYEAIYDQLSQIAPTVLTESLRVPWQDNFLVHAEALNKEAEAEALLAEYEAHIEEVQAILGDAIDETTISIIRFRPGQVRLYLKSSYIGYILQDVGLPRPESQDEDVFSSEISLEQVGAVDADYIFITGYAQDDSEQDRFLESPLWQTLGAVQAGHAIDVNDDTWIAGLGVQAANLVLEDLVTILGSQDMAAIDCEEGNRAIADATGMALCIPENPERIVGLMEADADALFALGITPVGVTNERGQQEPPRYLNDYLEGIPSTGQFYSPNLEVLLEMEPDLILFGGFTDEAVLEQLNAIAPTVNTFQIGEPWQSHFLRVAEILEKEAEAEEFMAAYEARLAEIQGELGEHAEDSFIIARWTAEGPQVMAPGGTFASATLLDLGLTGTTDIPELQEGHPHSAPLSLESLELLDTDWAFIGTLASGGDAVAALEEAIENPLFQVLEVVQNDQVVFVDGSLWTSIGGPIATMKLLDDVEAAMVESE